MKTIFTLLLATVLTSAFAADPSRLTISLASPNKMEVYVDGRVYQINNNKTILLNNIQSGNHTIQVYKARTGYSNNGKDVRNGRGNNRNDRNANRREDLLYSSTIYVRPSYHVDVMINRFGKALVDERVASASYEDDDYTDEGGWGNDGYGDGSYNNNYHQAMSSSDFNQLTQKIRNQWFGKLAFTRDAVNKNYFTTVQVREVLGLFTSDAERLELVKLAYPNTVDKQNFRQVYDQLSYSSQGELDRFIRDTRF